MKFENVPSQDSSNSGVFLGTAALAASAFAWISSAIALACVPICFFAVLAFWLIPIFAFLAVCLTLVGFGFAAVAMTKGRDYQTGLIAAISLLALGVVQAIGVLIVLFSI